MGISGLLPSLKKLQRDVNIKEYAGKRVAVDGHCWLHRGAISCADDLALGFPTVGYLNYFEHMIELLKRNHVEPLIVFDGQSLPIKAITNKERQRLREIAFIKGENCYKDAMEIEANPTKFGLRTLIEVRLKKAFYLREAGKYFRQAVKITPQMIHTTIKKLDQLGVQHIIAPYEADPQLTYLLRSGQVSAIITEDSDLLTYGNSNVLFKMDTGGWGKTIDYNEICPYISTHLKKEKINIKTNANVKFTPDMFRYSCIMAGCDYLPSLPGYGLKKAEEFVAQYDAIYKIVYVIKERYNKSPLCHSYADKFLEADAAFKYQFVFDMNTRTYCRLTPLPSEDEVPKFDMKLVSQLGESPQNQDIPLLRSNCALVLDLNTILEDANKENVDPFSSSQKYDEFDFDESELKDLGSLLEEVEEAPTLKSKNTNTINTATTEAKAEASTPKNTNTFKSKPPTKGNNLPTKPLANISVNSTTIQIAAPGNKQISATFKLSLKQDLIWINDRLHKQEHNHQQSKPQSAVVVEEEIPAVDMAKIISRCLAGDKEALKIRNDHLKREAEKNKHIYEDATMNKDMIFNLKKYLDYEDLFARKKSSSKRKYMEEENTSKRKLKNRRV